ncbi:oxidoreductase [Vallitalea okinawensis]|uniref:oxidoreductase n=1 Tax=Vallitalea okinawensis TaxID=2078660 RepID=UPI000CFE340B|nr:oxidoreductase [Vallitalea okinawensis]
MKKVALVTGASSGIGEDTAQQLMNAGYIVYAAARRLERMNGLKRKGARVIHLDVTDDNSMVNCINTIIKDQGRIDVLVNNAGYGSYGALEDVSLDEAKRQFEVNIFGLARLTQLVLPQMRRHKSGKIINISSIGGKFGEPHGAWYHATKYAVEGLSDSLRMELKEFNIDVIIIEPGAIITEWSGIAQKKLLEVSGNTAYGDLTVKHANMMARYDGKGSQPSVIGKTIVKAVTVNNPKSRYAVGANSGMMLFFRKILSDKMFDRFMLSTMK